MKRKIINAVRKLLGTDKLLILQHRTNNEIAQQNRLITEIYYANLFNSVISGSRWLKDQSFAPGRWAVDFAFLYTLFRILNEVKPKKIVEFGLGQTTRMISQYCDFSSAKAYTFEDNLNWVNFFLQSFTLSEKCELCLADLYESNYNGYDVINFKCDIAEKTGKDIELILLDGPQGSPRYSRIQILTLLPDHIKQENFCILIDDYQRIGEQDTAKEVIDLLKERNIKYLTKNYKGQKEHLIICSQNNNFLTSI